MDTMTQRTVPCVIPQRIIMWQGHILVPHILLMQIKKAVTIIPIYPPTKKA